MLEVTDAKNKIFNTGKGKFRPYSEFLGAEGYKLLPIRIESLDCNRYVITNEVGEFVLADILTTENLIDGTLKRTHVLYKEFVAKHFIIDETNSSAIDLLALKVRTKRSSVSEFTALHMFVVTLRCNQSCPYCQVSRQSEDRAAFDMSDEHIIKALDFTFRSPNRNIKIEFQGGESLLNFDGIKKIVEGAKLRRQETGKHVEFVAATNLTFLNDEILEFFKQEGIYISTSLDGPQHIHDKNRPYKERNAYQIVRENIDRAREYLGNDQVSALMTTTGRSLPYVKEIIDEYLSAGFKEIFLRPLSPYGFALRTKTFAEYDTQQWMDFYQEGLEYILDLNRKGIFFREIYTSIVLRKILTPFGTGYVNLQSPAGNAISGIVFNYDGKIYGSDEGRMLAEMNDNYMELGDLDNNTYSEIFNSEKLLNILAQSLPESSPRCEKCAFLPYCGSDPDYHYSRQQDLQGHKAFSGFCKKNMSIFKYLIAKLDDGCDDAEILRSWIL
jgi:uncharacterized protein